MIKQLPCKNSFKKLVMEFKMKKLQIHINNRYSGFYFLIKIFIFIKGSADEYLSCNNLKLHTPNTCKNKIELT